MPKKLDTPVMFAGAILALFVEAALVSWLWHAFRAARDPLAFYFGGWLSPVLPALSLAAIAAAMLHRLGLAFVNREPAREHWRHLRRLAYSFLALASALGCILYGPFGRTLR